MAGEKLPSVRPGVDVEMTREPIGVVGLITPWNFPIAIPAWKIAPALAYGNTVVFKPADLVPGCAWALADILVRAGLPAGVFNLVMGRGSVVGETLVNHPDVAALSLHRLGGDRARDRGQDGGADGEGAAGDGRQEPAGGARRRRPPHRGQLRGAGRVLLDRPALHGVVAADRHRRHPRPLRRGAHRPSSRRSRSTTRWPPGTDIGPVVDQSQLDTDLAYVADRQGRGRDAGATAASACTRAQGRLLPRAGAVHRGDQRDAHRARGDLRPGRGGDPRRRLRRGAGRRQRHRVRPVLGHRDRRRSSTRRTSSGTRRPAW